MTRRWLFGLIAACVVGCALTAAPAPADAAVTSLSVQQPEFTGRYGAGCTYTLSARVDRPGPVTFSVRQPTRLSNGKQLRFTFRVTPKRNVATFHWSPVVTGHFVLAARQQGSPWKVRGVDVYQRFERGNSCFGLW